MVTANRDVFSVFVEGREQALRFKWIESERANRDLGREAIERWVKEYWHRHLRAAWIDHIRGQRFFAEFALSSFSALQRKFGNPHLVKAIAERLEAGQENLDIINWSLDVGHPMGDVLEILAAVDVNSCRLCFHFPDC